MEHTPTISIIVPVYKVEQYLHRCLDSIRNQTFTDWECILIDDGSPDHSGEICDEYAQKDTRFRVIHQENAGVSAARIAGYNGSTGAYITFVDSDDYLTEDALQVMKDCLEENKVDVVVTESIRIFDGVPKENERRVFYGYKSEADIKKMKYEYLLDEQKNGFDLLLALWGKLYRREALEGVLEKGLGLWIGEDIFCTLHVYDKVKSIYILNKITYNYVFHSGTATNKHPMKLWEGYESFWKKLEEYDAEGSLGTQLSYRVWRHQKRLYFAAAVYDYGSFTKIAKATVNSAFVRKYVWKNKRLRESFTLNDYINFIHIRLGFWFPYWLLLRCRETIKKR